MMNPNPFLGSNHFTVPWASLICSGSAVVIDTPLHTAALAASLSTRRSGRPAAATLEDRDILVPVEKTATNPGPALKKGHNRSRRGRKRCPHYQSSPFFPSPLSKKPGALPYLRALEPFSTCV